MLGICFPLHHCKYSSLIQNKTEDSLSCFFESAGDRAVEFKPSLSIKINGHSVQVGEKKLWFTPGSKSVVIQEANRKDRQIEGKTAEKLRSAIKELQEHAAHLNLIKHSYWDRFCSLIGRSISRTSEAISASPKPIAPLTKNVLKHAKRMSTVIGTFRKSCGLAQFAMTLVGISCLVATLSSVLGVSIAVFQMIQGCLSILLGITKTAQSIKQYREAKSVHDVDGIAIFKKQIINALIVVVEGVLGLILGIILFAFSPLLIVCFIVALVFSILKYSLNYGAYTADSLVSLSTNFKTIQSIEKHQRLFEEGIAKNEKLNLHEKQKASRRFLERMVNVTEEQKIKICEKCRHFPLKIEKRMEEKLVKKRLIANRFGVDEKLLTEKNNAVLQAKVQQCFKTSIAAQEFSKFMGIVNLALNLLCIPLEVFSYTEIFKFIDFKSLNKVYAALYSIFTIIMDDLSLFRDLGFFKKM